MAMLGAVTDRRTAWWDSGQGAGPVGRAELLCWGLLLTWLWVSRWMAAPEVLYEWDSANYVLGMRDLDVFQHQPHPPGYPLYTLILRGLALLLPTPTGPFLLANGLFGSGILLLLGAMVRRSVGPAGALLLALAFSVCPPFWYQGAVSTAYVAECFCSVAVMATALAVARERLTCPAAALLLALLLGVRPSGALSFTPVMVVAALLRWPGWRVFGQSAAAFCMGCMLWLLPLLAFGGGLERYREATAALYEWQRTVGGLGRAGFNAAVLGRYLLDGMNLLWPAVGLNVAVVLVRREAGARTLALLLAWVVPGTAIYVFHHLAKSAYVLTLMPAGYVAAAVALGAVLPGLGRGGRRWLLAANALLLAIYLGLNLVGFYAAVPGRLVRLRDAAMTIPEPVLLLGDYGRHGLLYRTEPQRQMGALLGGLDPRRDLAVYLFGAHELHRLASASHPEQRRVATSIGHRTALFTPPTPQYPGTFGEFQTVVLRPPHFGNNEPPWVCLRARPGRLVLESPDGTLSLTLPDPPRRVVVFYAGPARRLQRGPGVRPVRGHRLGAGFFAWEVQVPGLVAASAGGASGPCVRLSPRRRRGQQRVEGAVK